MKAMKIEERNAVAIEAALHAANGAARQHAYTEYSEIAAIAEFAENYVLSLIGKKGAKGAVWTKTSGNPVCGAYAKKGFTRPATQVRMERRASGWFLTEVRKVEIGQKGGGDGRLTLTAEQASRTVEIFRKQFSVA